MPSLLPFLLLSLLGPSLLPFLLSFVPHFHCARLSSLPLFAPSSREEKLNKEFTIQPLFPRACEREGKRGRRGTSQGRWLFLFFFFLTIRAGAQPLVVAEGTVPGLKGAFGNVHLATGELPEPSMEPLVALLARAERGEIRIAVLGEPLKGLPKIRRLRLIGKELPDGSAVISPSTRTLGLVTAADLIGEGRPITVVPGGFRQIRYLAEHFEADEQAKVPMLALWGGFAGLALGVALLALRVPRYNKLARVLLVFATAGTLALLPAGLGTEAALQLGVFVLATLVIGSILASRHGEGKGSGVVPLLGLLVIVVALDTVCGWGMVAHATLSGFYGSGIRFYGIGNEYMGLLIGAALMSVPKKWLGGVGVLLTLLLGVPMLGANAGGAMAACLAFWPPVKGKRWRVLLPFAVAIALALLDHLLPSAVQSHMGQAAGKGPEAWGEIILRKLAMNARLSVAGPTLAGIAAIVVGVWQLKRLLPRVSEELRGRARQGYWGAAAAMAFNDSGTVAAILMLAPVIVTVIEQALCDYSESISAPSALVSP